MSDIYVLYMESSNMTYVVDIISVLKMGKIKLQIQEYLNSLWELYENERTHTEAPFHNNMLEFLIIP